MIYSRVVLSTFKADQPSPLPISVVGLADISLADLDAALDPVPPSLAGIAFWPVDFLPIEFDTRQKMATGKFAMAINAETKRVSATPVLRDLSAEEVAALPTLPVASLPAITPRQFFQALAMPPYAIITPQEALDAVKTGEIPAVMQAVIDTLPSDDQFSATMLVAGGQQFNREDPLVAIFGASRSMDEGAIDAFWQFARSL